MFEIRGAIDAFSAAVRRVPGLELVDEEELPSTEEESKPVAYLLVPDVRALSEIESLWVRWLRGEDLGIGFAPWRNVFSLLRDLRIWGPQDRVDPSDADGLRAQLDEVEGESLVRLEIELVFRRDENKAISSQQEVERYITAHSGRIVSSTRITSIAYHAILADLPRSAVEAILALSFESLASVDEVMHIRPQSVATSIEVTDLDQSAPANGQRDGLADPILAILDGVPVAGHPLLQQHLEVNDIHALEGQSMVSERFHGTAMASLIIHGDRNSASSPLPRKVHHVPVLSTDPFQGEVFPGERLLIDVIYSAVVSIRGGESPAAPHVLIVNLSLGNERKPFHGQMSPWARLLDYLAYEYGILFVVSAGNSRDSLQVPSFTSRTAFEDSSPADRSRGVIRALGDRMGVRRIISPAESINAVTVGSSNQDSVPAAYRMGAAALIDPYPELLISNTSSALGPGFGRSVKPDILMPGSKERLTVVRSDGGPIEVRPAGPSRACGIKVAAPGSDRSEGYTNGTSAAAALAARTCHLIHDALETTYGRSFTEMPSSHRAALLKALLCHTARWPSETVAAIVDCLGPAARSLHSQRKDNVRRFIGYGVVDSEDAVACAEDRATFWATGEIRANEVMTVPVPIPVAMSRLAQPHEICATVAWITPTVPGTRAYRSVRLKLLEPDGIGSLGISVDSQQPDQNQASRGTVFSRRWTGSRAAVVTDNMSLRVKVQREPDLGGVLVDEPIPFGVAVTIAMPGVNGIYSEVAQRLSSRARAQT